MTCTKIILAGTFSFPYGTPAASRIQNLAVGFLKASQAKVKVISHGVNQGHLGIESDRIIIGGEEIKYKGIVDHQVESSNVLNRIKYRSTFFINLGKLRNQIISELSGKEDEVLFLYGRSYVFLSLVIRALKKKGYKTKLVFDVVEPPRQTKSMLEYLKHPFLLDSVLVFKFLLPKFHACTFITHSLKRTYGKTVRAALVVPSVIYQESKDIAEENELKIGSRLEIGYMGSLLSKDYPELLFDFAENLHAKRKNFRLTVLGRFNNFSEGRIWKRKFLNSSFSDSVRFVANPNEKEKNLVLEELNFLVMFRKPDYLQEFTFPTRVVEYLAFGKTLIINKFGDFKHYFNEDNAIVISEQQITDSVNRFLEVIEEGKVSDLSRTSMKLLSSHFDPILNARYLLNMIY